MHMYKKQTKTFFVIVVFVLIGSLAALLWESGFAQFLQTTTLGTNINTTGNLTVTGDANYTFDAATERFIVNATNPDHTGTNGVVDIDVDIAATGAVAQNITVTNQGDYNTAAQLFNLTQGSTALTGDNGFSGTRMIFTGNNSDTGGSYFGSFAQLGAAYTGAASITGHYINLAGGPGGGNPVGGNGAVKAFVAAIQRVAGTGASKGLEITIDNDTTSSSVAKGIEINMDMAGGAPTNSYGIQIANTGGTLSKGLYISGAPGNTITRGIDITNTNQTMTAGATISNNGGGTMTTGLDIQTSSTSTTTTGIKVMNSTTGTTMTSGIEIASGSTGTITNGLVISTAGGTSNTITTAINIQNNSSQVMASGITLGATGVITTGIDLQDSDIVTAINIGPNTIASNGTLTGNLINFSWDTGTQTGVVKGINIDMGNITPDGTNALYGIHLSNNGAPTGSAERGVFIEGGTSWDYGLYVDAAVKFNTIVSLGKQALTITDDGTANDSLLPTASYVEATVNATGNGGTPNLLLDETGATEGNILIIVNDTGSNDSFTISDSAGVANGSAQTLGVEDSAVFVYTGTIWLQIASSDN